MNAVVRAVPLAFLTPFAAATLVPLAQAQEDCLAMAPAIDRALCEQPALGQLRDALVRMADLWQQHCGLAAERAPGSPRPHTAWLADLRVALDRQKKDVPAHYYLGSAFTQRADELAQALSSCARQPGRRVRQLRMYTIHMPLPTGQLQANTLPYVQTEPTLVGQRINEALYQDLLHIAPPLSPRPEAVREALSRAPETAAEERSSADETLQVSVLWRSPRLLVLNVDSSGCETRCWQNSEQHLFDLRTGDRVHPDDLLSSEGRLALNRLGERSILQAAAAQRRSNNAQGNSDGLEAFDRCIREWRGWRLKGGAQIVWLSEGRWQAQGPSCPGSDDGMLSSIVSNVFTLAALAPHLSAYGKSLLLGQGDVRTPEWPMGTCTARVTPPDPLRWGARVVDISAGGDHAFLREASGRVWGWGRNYNGAVGNGDPGSGRGNWVAPFVMGDDYLYAGAGLGFSAVVRRDGSLWTWGSGYDGRLGDGAGNRPRPARIGEAFTHADVDNYGGRALAQDGSLWAWGGSRRPPMQLVVARDVTEVRGSIPVLVLRRDGGLWAWNEWAWAPPGRAESSAGTLNWHGEGFVRLPRARKVEVAWRDDGTAWAWGRTLAARATPETLPGLEQSPWPRLVGRDWVDINAAEDYALVAGRKADGSLWVSQELGMGVRMEPLGCGFADMAFAYDRAHGVHLLALRSDGRLLDFHSSKRDGANVRRDLLELRPQVVANGGVKLFQENDYWGEVGAKVFLLRQDGTLWQWYWDFGGDYPDDGLPPDQRLRRIDFPEAWFQGRAPQR